MTQQQKGEKMPTFEKPPASVKLLQKITEILNRCVFDQEDSLTYAEGVALVKALPELIGPPAASEERGLTFGEWFTTRWPRGNAMMDSLLEAWNAALQSVPISPSKHYILFASEEDAQRAATILAKPTIETVGNTVAISSGMAKDLCSPPLCPREDCPVRLVGTPRKPSQAETEYGKSLAATPGSLPPDPFAEIKCADHCLECEETPFHYVALCNKHFAEKFMDAAPSDAGQPSLESTETIVKILDGDLPPMAANHCDAIAAALEAHDKRVILVALKKLRALAEKPLRTCQEEQD